MLIVKKDYDIGDVIGLKLVNGDEIVAKLAEITDEHKGLERPGWGEGGAKGMGRMQARLSPDPEKSIKVQTGHVMMSCLAIQQMRDHYIQVTTGIQLTPAGAGSI